MPRGPDRIFDEYLVVMSQGGSREALAVLVRRWSPRLRRYCARLLRSQDLGDDVMQEVWISTLGGLARLGDPARFPAWIYAIATRRCADAVRGRRRSRRLTADVSALQGIDHPSLGRSSPLDGLLDLAAAIDRLPLDQRLTVSLHYAEDLNVEEVAAVLNVPSGTVKSRLHHARMTLKQHLQGDSS
jgi:RNA polymerase sigma-70 factor, ECF subfamily